MVRLGIPEARVRCLPNSVDVEAFRPKGQKENNLLLLVGRINSGKGLPVLMVALKYIEHLVRLVVVGPPDWNSKYSNQMLKLIEQENLKSKHKIEYLGSRSQKDLVECINEHPSSFCCQ